MASYTPLTESQFANAKRNLARELDNLVYNGHNAETISFLKRILLHIETSLEIYSFLTLCSLKLGVPIELETIIKEVR